MLIAILRPTIWNEVMDVMSGFFKRLLGGQRKDTAIVFTTLH